MTFTLCTSCSASIAIDPATGEDTLVRAPIAGTMVCAHPETQIDPVTGEARPRPPCRAINFGACPFFTTTPQAELRRSVPAEPPADALPPILRKASADNA